MLSRFKQYHKLFRLTCAKSEVAKIPLGVKV